MEIDNMDVATTTTEQTTQTPQAESTPASGMEKIQAALNESGSSSGDSTGDSALNPNAAPAIPEYKPDLKYKAYGQEKELDARVHGIIKTKEDEEWIKKVFSAADGIEGVTGQRDQYRQSYQNLEKHAQDMIRAADLGDYKSVFTTLGVKPDFSAVIRGLGFTKEQVLQHAIELAQLTPEAEAAYARQYQLEEENKHLSLREREYQARFQAQAVQSREYELQTALSTPDIAPLVNAFDAHHGKGEFWNEVVKRGRAAFALERIDVPVATLVQEVAKYARGYGQATPQANNPIATQATPARQSNPDQLPVIPSVGAQGSQAPARRKIKSLADIEKELESLG